MHVHTASEMAKPLMFKLRLDQEDRDRLTAVAEHFSTSSATAVRMLIKEKYEEIERSRTRGGPAEVVLADEDPELWERVVKRYVKRAEADSEGSLATLSQPNRSLSTLDKDGNIVLRNTRGVLARYRLQRGKLFEVDSVRRFTHVPDEP